MNINKSKKVLSVWLDKTTDPDEPKWIVSNDELSAEGKTETTQTIKFFDEYQDAVEFAKERAYKFKLSVYETENETSAKNELILGLYHAEIENGDFGITTFFAKDFREAKELAIEWAEKGEWKEDDKVAVDLKGPDVDENFLVSVESSKIEGFNND